MSERDPGPGDGRGGFGARRWHEEPAPERPARPAAGSGAALDGEGELAEFDDEDAGERPARRRGEPEPSHPRLAVAALGASVRITRDAAGVPHVAAASERDAWLGIGWCLAHDRLWQLDLLRRLATGRAAEILGEDFVAHDAVVRTAGVPRRALLAARSMSGAARDVLASFTAGVNAGRAGGRPRECELLGGEVEPWTIADSLAIEIWAAWQSALRVWPEKLLLARVVATAGMDRARWLAAGPIDPVQAAGERAASWRAIDDAIPDLVAALPSAGTGDGVAFAAGDRGRPAVLGCALEAAPWLPAAFYPVSFEVPGLRVAGLVRPGVPLVVAGRNADCAWAGIAATVDDCECVIEEVDGIGNHRAGAGWVPLSVRPEIIRVRGGEPVRIEIAETRNGPLFDRLACQLAGRPDDPGLPAVALRWGAASLGTAVGGWRGVQRARSVAEVGRAVAQLERVPFPMHLVAGDRRGAVASWPLGAAPVRARGTPLPLSGASGEGAWSAMRPLRAAAAPRDEAFVARWSGSRRAEDAGGEFVGEADAAEHLRERARAGAVDASGLLGDSVDPHLRALLPALQQAIAAAPAGALPADLGERIAAWDGDAARDPMVASVCRAALCHLAPAALFPRSRFGAVARFPRVAMRGIGRILTSARPSPWFATAAERDREVLSWLATAHAWVVPAGTDGYRAASRAALRHPLDAEQALAAATVALPTDGRPPAGSGALSLRGDELPMPVSLVTAAHLEVDLAGDGLGLALAGGVSGDPASPHFLDLLAPLRAGETHRFRLDDPPRDELLELRGA